MPGDALLPEDALPFAYPAVPGDQARDGRLEPSAVRFRDDDHLMRILERIVARVGRRLDESSPMVDARLPDGSRLNAIIPPLSLRGPALSIRRFSPVPLTMPCLLE